MYFISKYCPKCRFEWLYSTSTIPYLREKCRVYRALALDTLLTLSGLGPQTIYLWVWVLLHAQWRRISNWLCLTDGSEWEGMSQTRASVDLTWLDSVQVRGAEAQAEARRGGQAGRPESRRVRRGVRSQDAADAGHRTPPPRARVRHSSHSVYALDALCKYITVHLCVCLIYMLMRLLIHELHKWSANSRMIIDRFSTALLLSTL